VLLQKDGNVDDNRNFTYDFVYGIDSNQQQVYDDSAFGLVESVLEGYNGKLQVRKYFEGQNYLANGFVILTSF
jgi:hypothetical protein